LKLRLDRRAASVLPSSVFHRPRVDESRTEVAQFNAEHIGGSVVKYVNTQVFKYYFNAVTGI